MEWDNGGGMEPAGSCIGCCLSEGKDIDYILEPAMKLGPAIWTKCCCLFSAKGLRNVVLPTRSYLRH